MVEYNKNSNSDGPVFIREHLGEIVSNTTGITLIMRSDSGNLYISTLKEN
ncbi:unnamed protein product, partial [marine sediment metagenome]